MIAAEIQEWPDGWGAVLDVGHRQRFREELEKEVGEQHVLWGVAVEVIARSYRADDILVLFGDSVAKVHLTWIGKRERDSRWPRTVVFPDIEAWRRTVGDD
jgi:hypothetical protein